MWMFRGTLTLIAYQYNMFTSSLMNSQYPFPGLFLRAIVQSGGYIIYISDSGLKDLNDQLAQIECPATQNCTVDDLLKSHNRRIILNNSFGVKLVVMD